jgi:hypothetical protein
MILALSSVEKGKFVKRRRRKATDLRDMLSYGSGVAETKCAINAHSSVSATHSKQLPILSVTRVTHAAPVLVYAF